MAQLESAFIQVAPHGKEPLLIVVGIAGTQNDMASRCPGQASILSRGLDEDLVSTHILPIESLVGSSTASSNVDSVGGTSLAYYTRPAGASHVEVSCQAPCKVPRKVWSGTENAKRAKSNFSAYTSARTSLLANHSPLPSTSSTERVTIPSFLVGCCLRLRCLLLHCCYRFSA